VAGQLTPACELFSPADIGRYVNESHRNRVIWATSTLCAEAILEAARVEAAGIVAGSVSLLELQRAVAEIRQRTGRARLPLTLLISEGFGSAPMAAERRLCLGAAVGRVIYLDAGERGELAWAEEPEVAFSPDDDGRAAGLSGAQAAGQGGNPAADAGEGDLLPPMGPLTPGLTVRLVDLDHLNQSAIVAGTARTLRLETGAATACVDVRLPDGTLLTVPVLNLEVTGEAEPVAGPRR
jgi:hypothetical protein